MLLLVAAREEKPAAAAAAAAAMQDKVEGEISKLLKYGRLEGDPYTAVEFLDQAVAKAERLRGSLVGQAGDADRVQGILASCFVARGNALLGAKGWEDADKDFQRAVGLLEGYKGGGGQKFVFYEASANCTVCNSREMAVALALDGQGIALGQTGRWEEAQVAFTKCLGVLAVNASSGLDVEEVPRGWTLSGLRGGAPTMFQRAQLNLALAKYGAGDREGALKVLQGLDKGPDPGDRGYPQFWDARAAQVAALYGNGFGGKAELEWKQLCVSHPPPPPSRPNNKVKLAVNRAAQRMLDMEALVTDNRCEDFESGTQIPCDDAGIPGLGGSSSPCVLYTEREVTARLWPSELVQNLADFRGQGT
ncbi:hypothetical protein HOP50_07g46420 [Chloropicon primus]|nr:hypothetical protein HOP50_07g46420 [Chloropicon primus]